MSNEDLYGPGFSEEESDDSVFEIQRLILEQEEAMQMCEDDLKRNTEQFHHEMSQLNLKYERQYKRAQELEAQNQMKDEQIRRLENELQAKADEIIKLKKDVAKFKVKMLPRCPSPGGKRRRGKSPSPSPQLPDSSDSCSLKLRGTQMLPLCPSPLGKRKICRGKSPSPSPRSPDSSDSCSLKPRGTLLKTEPKKSLPPTPPKFE